MSRIQIEALPFTNQSGVGEETRATTSSIFTALADAYRQMRALRAADDIRPVKLTIGQPPFASDFLRLFPYKNDFFETQFDLEAYRNATDILNDFFLTCIGNPDQSYRGFVNLTIKDYHRETTRKARHYLGERGFNVYLMMPTRLELQTAVIPAPDNLETLKEHPVATIMAINDPYILSGRLYDSNVYPPVNDCGEMHPLVSLDESGTYHPWTLDHLKDFFPVK